MKTTPSDARENDSAANRNINATALRIIIDSSSYNIRKSVHIQDNC